MDRHRLGGSFVATLLLAATLTVVGPADVAGADDSPATSGLATHCTIDTTSGTLAGLPAASPGSTVTARSSLVLDAGQAYQDVIGRPDGSTYYASVVELAPSGDPDTTFDASSATFTVGGTPTALVPGTKPSPDGFVLDSSGGRLRVYFPGDADAMLADVAGAGLPSVWVPANGTEYVLSASSAIGSAPTVVSGRRIDVATCRASMSTGPSARTTDALTAAVGIVEPSLTVTKTVSPPAVSPGGIATFTVTVAEPASTADAPVAPAFDVAVVDVLPTDLVPVTASGTPIADGATTGSGLRWSAADRSLRRTIARIDPGTKVDLQVRVRLAATTPPATDVTNTVSATATSAAGDVASERAYPPVTASAVLRSAAAAPTLTKTADRNTVVVGNSVRYTVTAVLPPSSTFENVTLLDRLPRGLSYAWDPVVACDACTSGPTTTNLGAEGDGQGVTRIGMYLGRIVTGAAAATLTWTYSTWLSSQYPDGTPVRQGDAFRNEATFGANIVDRLGGLTPRLATVRDGEISAAASATVLAAQPDITVEKRLVGASPVDPVDPTEWDIVLTNRGPVAATDVRVYDNDVSPSPGLWTGNLSVVGNAAAVSSVSGNYLTVREVPANGSTTIRIRVPWYQRGWAGPSPADYTLTNRIEVSDVRDPYGVSVPRPTTIASQAQVTLLRPDVELTKVRLSDDTLALGNAVRYRVTLTNHGAGSATTVQLQDAVPSGFGTIANVVANPAGAVTCAGNGCTLTSGRLAPGQTVSFDYDLPTTNASAGLHTNTIQLSYTDGANRYQAIDGTVPDGGVRSYDESATADVRLVSPQLSFAKTPELDDPGATIDVNGSAAFHLIATNTGGYTASNVVIDDPMPAHISADLASSTCEVFPAAGSSTCTIGGNSSRPTFTVSDLAPGAEMRATLAVRHDGSDPKSVGSDIENVATLSATGFTSISDAGGLNAQSGPKPPLPRKTVAPTSAGPGDTVTYTVDVDLQNANAALHDATLVDTVPDGLTDVTPVSITCVSGSCPPSLGWIAFEPSPNGGGRAAWFLGDQPMSTTGTVRVVYTARVAEAFVGGGVPTNGSLVRDGVPNGDPLKNAARVWFNDGVDRFGSAPSSVPTTATWVFTNRSVNSRASLDIATPRLTMTKSTTTPSLEAGDRTDPKAVGRYRIVVTNDGSRPAYAVDVVDDLASGELRDVLVEPLPVGVSTVDPWTAADPATTWRIDEIDPGESVTIEYTATPRTSPEMVDSRRSVVNTATVTAFHSTPGAAGPGDHTYPALAPSRVTTWVWTPHPRLGASGCSDPDAIGDLTWFSVGVSNSHPLGAPSDPDVGTLYGARLTVTLPAAVTFVPGSVLGTPNGGSEAAFRDPDTLVVQPDLSTTMTWDLGDLPSANGAQVLGLRWQVRATAVATAGLVAAVEGTDRSGHPDRGSAVGATTPYRGTGGAGCVHSQSIQKTPDGGTIRAGQALSWSVSVNLANTYQHPYTETGRVVDHLPAGFSYTPGTATFSDGLSTAAHGETVTLLPDGRTEIVWNAVTLTAPARGSASFSVNVPTRAAAEADLLATGALPRTFVNSAAFVTSAPTELGGTCDGLTPAICDIGSIQVESNNQPTVSKRVDHAFGPFGDTATFTVDVAVPANYAATGLFVRDYAYVANQSMPYWPSSTPQLDVGFVSAACVTGCTPGGADDISVTALPEEHVGYAMSIGWKTGAVAADTEARIVRLVYQVVTPEIDEVMSLPNCAAYGMALDSYYSCGKLTFRNTVDLFQSYSSLAGLGAGWWNSLWTYSISYRGTDTADLTSQVPDVRIAKSCTRPDGTAPGGNGADPQQPIELEQTSASVANVDCQMVVTNVGPGTAYYVQVEDRPATYSYYGYPMEWDVRSTTTPAPGTVDTPQNGAAVAVTLPELAQGASYTASFRARASLPSWANTVTSSPYEQYGSRFSNTARITRYDPDDFGTTHITGSGNRLSSTVWLDTPQARMVVAKQVNEVGAPDPALAVGNATCTQEIEISGRRLCSGTPPNAALADVHAPLEYHVVLSLADRDQLRTVTVRDLLPLGWSYVPGSARLDHWTVDGSGNVTTASTPFGDPGITAGNQTTCQWWNINGGYGDRLSWVFSRSATDEAAALWDDSLQWTGPSFLSSGRFDQTYRITFRAEPTPLWDECEPLATPGWDAIGARVENQVQVEATTIADGSNTFGASATVRDLDPPRFTKSPAQGYAIPGSTAVFTLDTDNVQRFALSGATVTEEFHDWSPSLGAPLYRPGSATITNEFGDAVPATEDVVHRSTGPDDPTVVRWTFDVAPAYARWEQPRLDGADCPVSATPDRPWWGECAARVRISIPIEIPDDEPDAHVYANHAELDVPDRYVTPTDGRYQGMGTISYGGHAEGDGQVTVSNPSPAPTPTKNGTWWATTNDTVDYTVQFTLPAGTTYRDLAYTDVLPDGLRFDSVLNHGCWSSAGTNCGLGSPTVLGPDVRADGTTAVSVSYGDVVGVSAERTVWFVVRAHVLDRTSDDRRIVAGDTLTDRVTGYSNEDDGFPAPTAPVTSAQHVSDTTAFTTNVDEPRITVEKLTDTPGPVAAGDVIGYTVRLRNQSNVTAYRVPVEDHPGAALTAVTLTGDTSAATKGWTPDDPSLAWEISQMWPGQTIDLTYTATVGPDPQTEPAVHNVVDVGTYEGRATVDPANREYDGPSAEVTLRFLSADLRLTKVPNPTGASPCPSDDPSSDSQVTTIGRPTPWCITVTNAGEEVAGAVVARDLLPPDWTYRAGSATVDGTPVEPTSSTLFGSALLRWDLGDLAPGRSVVVRYEAVPSSRSTATSQNSAWATAQRPDGSTPPAGAPGFRAADAATATLSAAGIEISKTPDRQMLPLVPGGGRATWDITIVNPSSTDLTGLVVTDTFPAGVTYVPSATTTTCAGSVETADAPTAVGQVVRWAIPSLRVGERCVVTVSVDVPAGLTGLRRYVNDAQVVSDQTTGVAANQAKLAVYEPAVVGDRVWHDLDGDGIQDADEPGTSGATVHLWGTDVEGNAVDVTVTTDGTGSWTAALPPGSYAASVDVQGPPGIELLAAPRHAGSDPAVDSDADDSGYLGSFTLVSGQRDLGLDAGWVLVDGSVAGRRWHDRNGNGIQDAGEEPIAGVTVTLSGSDTYGNSGTITTVTDADGRYSFNGLPPADLTITFDDDPATAVSPAGQGADRDVDSDVVVDPAAGARRIALFLRSGEHRDHLDEGTFLPVTVRGRAWTDRDRDGIREVGEPDRSGVTVVLAGTDGTGAPVLRTGVTDADGTVRFDGLAPGAYALRYATDGPATLTVVDAGSDDDLDSDADPATGDAPDVTVTSGDDVDGGHAGYVEPTNLTIAKTVVAGPTTEGVVTYRLRVTNTGERPTEGDVTIADPMPAGLVARSADGGDGWRCAVEPAAVLCRSLRPIAPGSSTDVLLVAVVSPDADGEIANVATVASSAASDNATTTDDADTAQVRVARTTSPSTTTSTVPTAPAPTLPDPRPSAPTVPAPTDGPGIRRPAGGPLAFTGSDATRTATAASMALALGLGLLLARRRRRRDTR